MEKFHKFPTTPHLLWLGKTAGREDKLWTRPEAEDFLSRPVVVEEKVDGANLGISFNDDGDLLVQNRGNFIERGTKGQFTPLWAWLSKHEAALFDVLENRLILFGEWCYARHSIHYTRLPDWFLAFDLLDKPTERFLSTERRDQLVGEMRLASVPKLGGGSLSIGEIAGLIVNSHLYDGPMEGCYLRRESDAWLTRRAKVVRAEFVQQIGEHWSKQPLVPNCLLSVCNRLR